MPDFVRLLKTEGIAECVWAGANIVGGCCGITPEHIEAVCNRLSDASRS